LRGNHFQDAVQIFNDIGIPKTENCHALTFHPFIAPAITDPRPGVLATVELDGETQCRTVEVQNITAGWMLAAKARGADLTTPQPLPETPFDVSAIAPKSSRELGFPSRAIETGHTHDPHPALRADLPLSGGGGPSLRHRRALCDCPGLSGGGKPRGAIV